MYFIEKTVAKMNNRRLTYKGLINANDRKDLIQPLEASFDDVAARWWSIEKLKKPRSDVLKALKTGLFLGYSRP